MKVSTLHQSLADRHTGYSAAHPRVNCVVRGVAQKVKDQLEDNNPYVGKGETTINSLGPLQAFGEMALHAPDGKRQASVVAVEHTRLISIHGDEYRRVQVEWRARQLVKGMCALRETTWFADWPDAVLWKTASSLREKTFAPGEVIAEQGKPANTMFFITLGQAHVRRSLLLPRDLASSIHDVRVGAWDKEGELSAVVAREEAMEANTQYLESLEGDGGDGEDTFADLGHGPIDFRALQQQLSEDALRRGPARSVVHVPFKQPTRPAGKKTPRGKRVPDNAARRRMAPPPPGLPRRSSTDVRPESRVATMRSTDDPNVVEASVKIQLYGKGDVFGITPHLFEKDKHQYSLVASTRVEALVLPKDEILPLLASAPADALARCRAMAALRLPSDAAILKKLSRSYNWDLHKLRVLHDVLPDKPVGTGKVVPAESAMEFAHDPDRELGRLEFDDDVARRAESPGTTKRREEMARKEARLKATMRSLERGESVSTMHSRVHARTGSGSPMAAEFDVITEGGGAPVSFQVGAGRPGPHQLKKMGSSRRSRVSRRSTRSKRRTPNRRGSTATAVTSFTYDSLSDTDPESDDDGEFTYDRSTAGSPRVGTAGTAATSVRFVPSAGRPVLQLYPQDERVSKRMSRIAQLAQPKQPYEASKGARRGRASGTGAKDGADQAGDAQQEQQRWPPPIDVNARAAAEAKRLQDEGREALRASSAKAQRAARRAAAETQAAVDEADKKRRADAEAKQEAADAAKLAQILSKSKPSSSQSGKKRDSAFDGEAAAGVLSLWTKKQGPKAQLRVKLSKKAVNKRRKMDEIRKRLDRSAVRRSQSPPAKRLSIVDADGAVHPSGDGPGPSERRGTIDSTGRRSTIGSDGRRGTDHRIGHSAKLKGEEVLRGGTRATIVLGAADILAVERARREEEGHKPILLRGINRSALETQELFEQLRQGRFKSDKFVPANLRVYSGDSTESEGESEVGEAAEDPDGENEPVGVLASLRSFGKGGMGVSTRSLFSRKSGGSHRRRRSPSRPTGTRVPGRRSRAAMLGAIGSSSRRLLAAGLRARTPPSAARDDLSDIGSDGTADSETEEELHNACLDVFAADEVIARWEEAHRAASPPVEGDRMWWLRDAMDGERATSPRPLSGSLSPGAEERRKEANELREKAMARARKLTGAAASDAQSKLSQQARRSSVASSVGGDGDDRPASSTSRRTVGTRPTVPAKPTVELRDLPPSLAAANAAAVEAVRAARDVRTARIEHGMAMMRESSVKAAEDIDRELAAMH